MLSIRKIGVIGRTLRTYRHLKRYRTILGILFKYGFGDFLEMLKIDQYLDLNLPVFSKNNSERVHKLGRAVRVRLAIEELGPTFVKLGQILSTRLDLVPMDFIHELAKLQDEVPPFSFDEVKDIVFLEFKTPLNHMFLEFAPTPIASASIGQVHKARLNDGEVVAVKVQRPNIRNILEVDLEIMLHLAMLMERYSSELELHNPVKIIEEFAHSLEQEIDYTTEAANLERMARNFLDDPTLYVPKVFREVTSLRVLTMEYVHGIKISDVTKLDEAGLDRKLITRRGAEIVLKQVFHHGFFHADPHPGNVFVLEDNVICLLDFGMVGTVDRQTREDFVDLLDALARTDEAKATRILLKLTIWEDEPDLRVLEKDVANFMAQHVHKRMKEVDAEKVLQQLLHMVSRHRLKTRPDIFMMLKAFSAIEGVTRLLDPDFDMLAQATPFIERIKLAKFAPQRIANDLLRFSGDMVFFMKHFPNEMRDIMRLFRDQRLVLNLNLRELNTVLETAVQISNRIVFAIIIAALIIGSAIIVLSQIPPLLFGISIIGLIGFSVAGLMGFWVIISMMRKRKL